MGQLNLSTIIRIMCGRRPTTTNQIIDVYIGAVDGTPFKGFYIKALDPDQPNEADASIGFFAEGDRSQVYNLGPGCVAITHTDQTDKTQYHTQWKAPNGRGNVYFKATMVKSFEQFYVGLDSRSYIDLA